MTELWYARISLWNLIYAVYAMPPREAVRHIRPQLFPVGRGQEFAELLRRSEGDLRGWLAQWLEEFCRKVLAGEVQFVERGAAASYICGCSLLYRRNPAPCRGVRRGKMHAALRLLLHGAAVLHGLGATETGGMGPEKS